MILFDNDWNLPENQGAIVHNATTNESFKRLAYVYKKRGIKNHKFLLALHNPDLEFVDPHDPDLTMIQQLAVAKESRMNYWYFLREVVRLDATGSPEPTKIDANRGVIAAAWCFWNYVNTMLILIRQARQKFIARPHLHSHTTPLW